MKTRKTLARAPRRRLSRRPATRDLRRAALARAAPRQAQAPSRVREPALSYAAGGLLALAATLLLDRAFLCRRGS